MCVPILLCSRELEDSSDEPDSEEEEEEMEKEKEVVEEKETKEGGKERVVDSGVHRLLAGVC